MPQGELTQLHCPSGACGGGRATFYTGTITDISSLQHKAAVTHRNFIKVSGSPSRNQQHPHTMH